MITQSLWKLRCMIHASKRVLLFVSNWQILEDMALWSIRNGEMVEVWKDCWTISRIKLSNFTDGLSKAHQRYKVSDLVDINGE